MSDRRDSMQTDAATANASTTAAALDARYGRTPGDRARLKVLLWSLGSFFVLVFAAWVIWGGLLAPAAQLDARDIAHTIVSDQEVEVTYQLTIDPGTRSYCALQAQDEQHSIIGWKVVEIPASSTRTRQFTDSVRTVDLATTGLIYRCWQA
ncbi:protein of unknown function [Paramicrobacterium humi]|uniref:DUF4307 domain-containing protein n=1 Tax=Paramicrobacterium humi TaxID=640635 RepID=A0A1H4IMS3_9MICO|nr:DUF4307 domain-containing protein [Microbacterium humi]SEB35253.1 protein of unknown function [Microbacterium humi]